MKLLLDEMYSGAVAEQLRARGHDVVSIHDPTHRKLEGAPDQEVFATAVSQGRAVVTENVPDFRWLENEALASGGDPARLIFTTNRQFPRGDPATRGRLVLALDALLAKRPDLSIPAFLKAPPSP